MTQEEGNIPRRKKGPPSTIGSPLPDDLASVDREDDALEQIPGDPPIVKGGIRGLVSGGALPLSTLRLGV